MRLLPVHKLVPYPCLPLLGLQPLPLLLSDQPHPQVPVLAVKTGYMYRVFQKKALMCSKDYNSCLEVGKVLKSSGYQLSGLCKSISEKIVSEVGFKL